MKCTCNVCLVLTNNHSDAHKLPQNAVPQYSILEWYCKRLNCHLESLELDDDYYFGVASTPEFGQIPAGFSISR